MDESTWDSRYRTNDYIYGKEPNPQFREFINGFTLPGKILLPGEGEGRNGVYAAKKGWKVTAADSSREAINKAHKLATSEGVSLVFHHADIFSLTLERSYYDVVALVFFHVGKKQLIPLFSKLTESLRKGGTLFVVGFHEDQLKHGTGGPKSIDMLYTPNKIKESLRDIEIVRLEKMEFDLREGSFHNGVSSIMVLEGIRI